MARGAAVVDGNVAYFMNWDGRTCSYDSSTRRWSKLPQCPSKESNLVVIRGLLTAVGGSIDDIVPCYFAHGRSKRYLADNKLFSIINDGGKKWVEHFPPMPTERYNTATVTTKQHIIVAGGESGSSGSNLLDMVEVMDIQTLVWSAAASLPHPYTWASATICGDQIYILGGCDEGSGKTKSALTCSLTKLLQSCSEASSDSVWHRITDIPVYSSTCAAVNGELVAVGGVHAYETSAAIHKYNPASDSWDIISNMPTARYRRLVAVLPTNEMMVVGGCGILGDFTDKVEIATL